MTELNATRTAAQQMDAQDKLAHFREAFHLPRNDEGVPYIYLLGHSLGLQPKHTAHAVQQELEYWKDYAALAHFTKVEHPWVSYHLTVADHLAKLVGGSSNEVIAMNSLTVNLHLLLVSFYRPIGQRRKILIEENVFSSDNYALESHIRFHGGDINHDLIIASPHEMPAVLEQQGHKIALVYLGAVNYLSGYVFDIKYLSELVAQQGCVFGLDLAHAIGNIVMHLHEWQVDFAVWCSYKYLNAGPGAIGGAFIHQKYHHQFDLPRFAGWWGHDAKTRFQMPAVFQPIATAEGWQLSNPNIFSLAALQSSLEIFTQATLPVLREKSVLLTRWMSFLLKDLASEGIQVLTPEDELLRGNQISFTLPPSKNCYLELLKKKAILCDVRKNHIFRVALTPLYNSFEDAWNLYTALKELLKEANV